MSKDSEHLQWIHDRMGHVHGENENYDYMIRLRKIISELESKEKREYVFVTWDPLYERVLCVHKKQESTCKVCEKVAKENSDSYYFLESKKLMIKG